MKEETRVFTCSNCHQSEGTLRTFISEKVQNTGKMVKFQEPKESNFPSRPPSPIQNHDQPEQSDPSRRDSIESTGSLDSIGKLKKQAHAAAIAAASSSHDHYQDTIMSVLTIEENDRHPTHSGLRDQNMNQRDSVSWLDFDKKDSHSHLGSKLGHSMQGSWKRFSIKGWLLSLFPLFDRLQPSHYSYKEDLLTDIIAGVTIAILHIPQGIAYSFLIGISPVYGLYTSFFPVLLYAFMGSAQHISIGKRGSLFFSSSSFFRSPSRATLLQLCRLKLRA